MVGVVLISHGDLAKGIISSAAMLLTEPQQLTAAAFYPSDNPDELQEKIAAAVKEVDTGEGVVILADMLGGTPCNRAMYSIGDKVRMLTGLSLPMLYTLLTVREETSDLASLAKDVLSEAADGMVDVNELMKTAN